MTGEAHDRIEAALRLIEGQAALVEAQLPEGMMGLSSLPLTLAAAELNAALRIVRIRRFVSAALIETLLLEGTA